MKIETHIRYEESYLPKNCRKPRYRECEDYVDVDLKEVEKEELRLAFKDNSYNGLGKIYSYNNKLWYKKKLPNESIIEELRERGFQIHSALDYLIYCNEHCSAYFRFASDREIDGKDTSRDAVIGIAKAAMENYILVNGELYTVTSEPRYVVQTFGLGHNHGGTSMFVEYGYNPNIRKENYFSALDSEKAVAYADKIASARGDTNNVGKFRKLITVYAPELVKVNPYKDGGYGNELLNTMEDVITGANDMLTAGLLAISLITKLK